MSPSCHWTIGLAVILMISGFFDLHQVVVDGATLGGPNKLLVLLIDGFRWDYFDKFNQTELPGFNKLRQNGVSAGGIIPAFPSLSIVNYYSLMTGLYAENHGMVDNYMYDIKNDKEFLIGNNPDQYYSFWWNDGEPLWTAATRQGKRSYFWYWNGCEVEIRGYRPTFCSPYQSTPDPSFANFSIGLDLAVQVLRNNSADVAGVYLGQVDTIGHASGTNSVELRNSILQLDSLLLRTLNAIEQQSINIIIFSDHGMADRIGGPPDNQTGLIHVLDYVSESDWDHAYGSRTGPVLQIWPKSGKLEAMYNTLRTAHPNLTAYLKDDIPDRYHLKGHYRVPPLYLVADKGYAISRTVRYLTNIGYHGYDNTAYQEMRGILFASGPDFKRNVTFRERFLPNVNVYQLMCHVMQLIPQPHNGTWSSVCDGLANSRACVDGPYTGPYTSGSDRTVYTGGQRLPVTLALLAWAMNFVGDRRTSG